MVIGKVSKDTGLESLNVWQKAMDFSVKVCREIVPLLPLEEKYALTSQLRRSVQSIPANIAEGYGRYYFQDNVRFCYIARGSLGEIFSHLILADKLGYLPKDVLQSMMQLMDELRRMLNGYIAFLKRSKRGENEPGAKSHIQEDFGPYFTHENLPESPDTNSPDS